MVILLLLSSVHQTLHSGDGRYTRGQPDPSIGLDPSPHGSAQGRPFHHLLPPISGGSVRIHRTVGMDKKKTCIGVEKIRWVRNPGRRWVLTGADGGWVLTGVPICPTGVTAKRSVRVCEDEGCKTPSESQRYFCVMNVMILLILKFYDFPP